MQQPAGGGEVSCDILSIPYTGAVSTEQENWRPEQQRVCSSATHGHFGLPGHCYFMDGFNGEWDHAKHICHNFVEPGTWYLAGTRAIYINSAGIVHVQFRPGFIF